MFALFLFLSPELHVLSGLEVSDQPVHSHPAGPHHRLPRTGGPGESADGPTAGAGA